MRQENSGVVGMGWVLQGSNITMGRGGCCFAATQWIQRGRGREAVVWWAWWSCSGSNVIVYWAECVVDTVDAHVYVRVGGVREHWRGGWEVGG